VLHAVRRPVAAAAPHLARLGRLRRLLLLVQLLDGLNLLLQLHPPVLEPNFDLPLRETELVRHLYPPPPGEVVVGVKLLLQLQRLISGVGLPASPPQPVGSGEEMRASCRQTSMAKATHR